MKVLLAFDVDGTLETSAGPVTVARLQQLVLAGAEVAIVSPSGARPDGFPIYAAGARADNLRAARHGDSFDLSLYVSDNNDQAAADEAGFIYVDRLAFR